MTRIPRVLQHTREISAQRLDVRLHARARATLGPQQSFAELRRAGALSLGPKHQGLAQHLFPFAQRAPHIAIRATECPSGMANRAALENGAQQFKQRIAERSAMLFPRLEGIVQMQL